MTDLNKVTLIGRVGQDPKTYTLKDGGAIIRLSLATSESWKDKNTGEWKSKTEWHNVSVYSQGLVALVQRAVQKGTQLYIEGKIKSSQYKDGDGNEKTSYEIALNGYDAKIIVLSGKKEDSQTGGEREGSSSQVPLSAVGVSPIIDDEIPF